VLNVKAGGWLIEKDNFRFHRKAARNRDALSLSAGERGHEPSAKVGDVTTDNSTDSQMKMPRT